MSAGVHGQTQCLARSPFEQCWLGTNPKPIGTKWIAINKGDGDRVETRSQLVATEPKVHPIKMGLLRDDVFSATPPLEALRLLMFCLARLLGKPPRTVNQIVRTSLDHERNKSGSSHHRSASAGDAPLTTREVALPPGSAATPHPWVPRHARGHFPFTPYARSSLSKPPNWQPHRPCP